MRTARSAPSDAVPTWKRSTCHRRRLTPKTETNAAQHRCVQQTALLCTQIRACVGQRGCAPNLPASDRMGACTRPSARARSHDCMCHRRPRGRSALSRTSPPPSPSLHAHPTGPHQPKPRHAPTPSYLIIPGQTRPRSKVRQTVRGHCIGRVLRRAIYTPIRMPHWPGVGAPTGGNLDHQRAQRAAGDEGDRRVPSVEAHVARKARQLAAALLAQLDDVHRQRGAAAAAA